MNREFWLDKWRQGQTGFHAARPNRFLMEHGPKLKALATRSRGDTAPCVYVPLCGRSLDLHALAQLGFRVVGTELSPLATEAFFSDQNTVPQVRQLAAHRVLSAGAFTLYEGDAFTLPSAELSGVDAVYDRAAFVAMPPEMRAQYCDHLRRLMRPGGALLLVAFEYDATRMSGPPFSVDETCVRAFWSAHARIEELGSVELIDEEPRFRERGVDSIRERAWLIRLH